jgi:hypothetical protein
MTQDVVDKPLMFLLCLAIYEYVIDISDNTKSYHILKDIMNHVLK